MEKTQLLENLNKYMADKGLDQDTSYMDQTTKLQIYGLPALKASKNILGDIYSYKLPTGNNLVRKIKNKLIGIIRNVTISTVELLVIRQNKFNELSYQLIEHLLDENEKLKSRISELEKHD